MKKVAATILALLIASGCRSISVMPTGSDTALSAIKEVAPSEPLSVLSVVGGLCLLAGMVLLVVTKGTRGWYPVIGGLILTVLNYVVAKYDDYLFYPLVVFTGCISAAWTYKIVKQILLEKKKL
jgi:hypothetical protein